MGYKVETDHQIIWSNDRMVLVDASSLVEIVTATLVSGWWTIHTDGVADVTVDNRSDAVDQLIAHALEKLPGTGYSCLVPHGLKELP